MSHVTRSRRVAAAVLAGGLLFAACGDDDGGSGGGDQGELADLFLDFLDEEGNGITVDDGCVRDLIGQLSDEDAAIILEAGVDGDPEGVSAGGEAIGEQIFTDCIGFEE